MSIIFSRYYDSFVFINKIVIIKKENFFNKKNIIKISDGISIDNFNFSLIYYIKELAKKNLVIRYIRNIYVQSLLYEIARTRDHKQKSKYRI